MATETTSPLLALVIAIRPREIARVVGVTGFDVVGVLVAVGPGPGAVVDAEVEVEEPATVEVVVEEVDVPTVPPVADFEAPPEQLARRQAAAKTTTAFLRLTTFLRRGLRSSWFPAQARRHQNSTPQTYRPARTASFSPMGFATKPVGLSGANGV
jgi:hypothetical protein